MPTLKFTDLSALRAALEADIVPAEVQAAPAGFARFEDGALGFEPTVSLPRGSRKRMIDAGVQVSRKRLPGGRLLGCWAEALPVLRGPEPVPPLGEVLFLSEGDEGFLSLAGELLRLGSEDQRLAFFTDEDDRRRNLCRVGDPPYYAVLRALDPDDPLRAFTPLRPGGRVWIELGYHHPQARQLDCDPGTLLLLPAPSVHALAEGGDAWLRVPDGPWLDLHAHADVHVPEPSRWQACAPGRRLEVQLRLVRAPAGRAPTLWVIRERTLEQLERLVRTVPDSVVAQLRVATGTTPEGELQAVIRARRSAKNPPALDLEAEAFVPAPQIPDLFLPLGNAIDPPLRPSRVRELLLDGSDRVVWLASDPATSETRRGHAFRRESLDESAFCPLSEWVDYLVGSQAELLEPWVRSATFDLDAFVSIGVEWAEGEGPKAKKGNDNKKRRQRRDGRQRQREEAVDTVEVPDFAVDTPADTGPAAELPELAPVNLPRSAIEERLSALEQEFCELDAPLDDPRRAPMWAELANLQASLHRPREAGLCWARAMWERPSNAPTLLARWVQSEAQMLGYPDPRHILGLVDAVASDLDEQMIRGLAAMVLRELDGLARGTIEAGDSPLTPELLARLQTFFAGHGGRLDLRSLWLVRSALAAAAGDDRLALFQTRDFVMAALRDGTGLARNIPAFVRAHGSDGDAGELGLLADELLAVRDRYLTTKRNRSATEATHPEEPTHAYVRCIFAWGLARLGRTQEAREERQAARGLLGAAIAESGAPDPIHRAAFSAFDARITQALDGQPTGAPLPTAVGGPVHAREQLGGLDRYKYDRLVELSRILDPRHEVDAFDRWARRDEEPYAGLALLTDPPALTKLYDQTFAQLPGLGSEARARALAPVLETLEALPEPLALPRLQLAIAAIAELAELDLAQAPPLLRSALLLASYYDRSDLVEGVLALLERHDEELATLLPSEYAELLARAAPTLRRAGFEARLAATLSRLAAQIGEGAELDSAVARLHVTSAYAALGETERVREAFARAHALLSELDPATTGYQVLLRELAIALSRSNASQAIAGARALLERLPETTDHASTNSHYCLAVVQLMEAVVLSLASEDLVLSEWARRWVEEDEHLLHRRIHRDLSAG